MLIEAASLGPAYATKRREILGRFAALVRHHLDEAVAEGSIPPLDTGVAAYAWLGALNEVAMQSLEGELPAPADAAHTLSALLLRSVGAAETGAMAGALSGRPPPRAQLSTYPPSSTDVDPPHLARLCVRRQPAEPRQIEAREGEASDRPMNARARTIRRRASA